MKNELNILIALNREQAAQLQCMMERYAHDYGLEHPITVQLAETCEMHRRLADTLELQLNELEGEE